MKERYSMYPILKRLSAFVVFSFYFLMFSLSISYAQDRTLTLQEAYKLSLQNHEAVKIAEEGLYQFEQSERQAVANILPTVTADAGYTKYSTEKRSAITVLQPDYSYNYSVRLGVPIYRGGREWSALRQAKYLLKAGEKGLSIVQENILMGVANAYYGVLKITKEIEIKEADLKRAEERRRVSSARFNVGEVTKTAVLRSEAEVAGIQADLSRARMGQLVAQDRLARLVGLSPGFKLSEPPQKDVPKEEVEQFIKVAYDKRDDYLKSKAEEEIAKEVITFTKGSFKPTLRLDGVYSWRNQDPLVAAFFTKESIFATLTLSYPLYEGGLRMAELRESESKLRESEYKRLNIRKDIENEVREAYYNLEAFSSAIEFYKKQVSFAEENYNTVFKQYTYGLSTNVDVIDANSVLVNAQQSLANSSFDLQIAILALKRSMGVLLTEVKSEW